MHTHFLHSKFKAHLTIRFVFSTIEGSTFNIPSNYNWNQALNESCELRVCATASSCAATDQVQQYDIPWVYY